jgi:hypothetical protein
VITTKIRRIMKVPFINDAADELEKLNAELKELRGVLSCGFVVEAATGLVITHGLTLNIQLDLLSFPRKSLLLPF